MLDIDLQKRLDQAAAGVRKEKPALSRTQHIAITIAVSLFMTTVGIATYAQLNSIPSMPSDDLGKLAVLVSDVTESVPADIWAAMENHIGKPAENFNADDQVRAVAFLLELIENQPKPTINIW
ncbi:hypothetical protein [Thalassospira sp. MCCC 1A03138]|uniref:hypothetical protein n=1 Tax=Thalassospira sp. MCCC 1A03138 TaxID=1470576 RepID=UPI000A1F8BDB|nr:hypothetical protein [Thalassospira sp. MCCC 1A03138]OSQ30622.1 hypothetical protein TH468_10370 [Thalassospira sp. MCCC 1A03138]